jgi:hypothetical protein
MDVQDLWWGGMDWIALVQDKGQNADEFGNEPLRPIKFREFLD